MADNMTTMQKIDFVADMFERAVELESATGIGIEASTIEQFITVYELFFEGFFAKSIGDEFPPAYPDCSTSEERCCFDRRRHGTREKFGWECENIAAAIACDNPNASTQLYMLANHFVQREDERIAALWPSVRAGLQCSLAQLDLKSEADGGRPVLNERQKEVLKIIRKYGPIQEKEIEKRMSTIVSPGSIRRHDISKLKRYGVKNVGHGYFIQE